MIHALNNSRLEAGFAAYLEGRFETLDTEVPKPDAEHEETITRGRPLVVPGVSVKSPEFNAPGVAVLGNDAPADVPGLYGDRLVVTIATVTPITVPGISEEDHRALADVVASCFPERPAKSSLPTYAADLAAWEALSAELSNAVETAAGYRVCGWTSIGGGTGKGEGRVEQILKLRPSIAHPDVL